MTYNITVYIMEKLFLASFFCDCYFLKIGARIDASAVKNIFVDANAGPSIFLVVDADEFSSFR